jgi:hypothetical protein
VPSTTVEPDGLAFRIIETEIWFDDVDELVELVVELVVV